MTAAENQVSGAENLDMIQCFLFFFFSGMGAQAHRTAWLEESELVSNFSFLVKEDFVTSKKLGEDAFIKLSCVAYSTCFRCFSLKGKKAPAICRIWQAAHLFRLADP